MTLRPYSVVTSNCSLISTSCLSFLHAHASSNTSAVTPDTNTPMCIFTFSASTLNSTWACLWALSEMRKRRRLTNELSGSCFIINGKNPSANWSLFWFQRPLNKSLTPSGNDHFNYPPLWRKNKSQKKKEGKKWNDWEKKRCGFMQ